MQTNKSTHGALVLILATITLGLGVCRASDLTWSGGSSVTNLWSDINNWSPAQAPTAGDVVTFTNAGSISSTNTVNNAVNSSPTISNLSYSQITNILGGFHTTLIDTGATLTVNSPILGTNTPVLHVGADVSSANDQVWTWIKGTGTLAVGDLNAPDTNKDIMVSARVLTAAGGFHKAVLDMTGLNKFTFGGGRFQVACDGAAAAVLGSQYAGLDRAWGSVVLAKTNIITTARPRSTQIPYAISPFALAVNRYANSVNQAVTIDLGQENTINTEAITVAGARAQNVACTLRFRAGLVNPTLKLRGADGVSRVAEIGIGDNNIPTGATVQSIGVLDLSLGTVDALVDTIIVGRNNGYLGVQSGANGTGTLTLGAGTLDVNTLIIGCQSNNTLTRATGTVTVRTNTTLIAGSIYIGRDAGDSSGFGTGTLTLQGGTARVSGDITETDGAGGSGGSTLTLNTGATLDMKPSGDTVPGNISVKKLSFALCTLTNYGTLSVSNIAIVSPATTFTLYPSQALAPYAKGVAGTLIVNGNGGNLTLAGGTVDYDLSSPGASDAISVSGTLTLSGLNNVDLSAFNNGTIATGTYNLMSAVLLVGDASNLQATGALAGSRYTLAFDTITVPNNVNLTISGSTGNLTWSGDGAGNVWNLQTSTNWNGQTQPFYNLDTVTFDDSSTNQIVTLAGTLSPSGITVASASNYTFTGSGKLSGSGGLTLNGTGALTLGTPNDFYGAVNINAGTLLVNGALGNAPVTVASGATLGGSGTILGPVTVQDGGTLSPGSSIATLAISNNLTLNNATTIFEANMTTLAQDKIVGLTSVTYGGTLQLVFTGRPVISTDSFKLFDVTTAANPAWLYNPYSGTFSSIEPATPGPGMVWNTSTLATDGTLRITSTAAPNMSSSVTGNLLSLAWPPDHLGWHLQAQTNALNIGLTTTWFDVANTAGGTNFTTTIDPANGSVFYRLVLVYP